MGNVQHVQDEYRTLLAEAPPSDELAAIRWMIEELRVSYFAQAHRHRPPRLREAHLPSDGRNPLLIVPSKPTPTL